MKLLLLVAFSLSIARGQFSGFCIGRGSPSTYNCSIVPQPGKYFRGMVLEFRAAFTNIGASTLNLNNLGSIPIVKGVSLSLDPGDIQTGQMVLVAYDGVAFQMLSAATPTDSQFSSLMATWTATHPLPQGENGPPGPPGSSGVTLGSLGFSVSLSSPTTLTIGSECTQTSPCQATFNTIPIRFENSSTVTYQSGTGNLRVYLGMTADGVGYVGVAPDNMALLVICDTCTVNQPPSPNPPVTEFPTGSIPIAAWSVTTAGQFDSAGLDLRSPLRSSFTQVGTGLSTIQPPGNVVPQVMVDQTSVPTLSPIPATMTDICAPPQIAVDAANHLLYVCVQGPSPSLWLRATLSTWP